MMTTMMQWCNSFWGVWRVSNRAVQSKERTLCLLMCSSFTLQVSCALGKVLVKPGIDGVHRLVLLPSRSWPNQLLTVIVHMKLCGLWGTLPSQNLICDKKPARDHSAEYREAFQEFLQHACLKWLALRGEEESWLSLPWQEGSRNSSVQGQCPHSSPAWSCAGCEL